MAQARISLATDAHGGSAMSGLDGAYRPALGCGLFWNTNREQNLIAASILDGHDLSGIAGPMLLHLKGRLGR